MNRMFEDGPVQEGKVEGHAGPELFMHAQIRLGLVSHPLHRTGGQHYHGAAKEGRKEEGFALAGVLGPD